MVLPEDLGIGCSVQEWLTATESAAATAVTSWEKSNHLVSTPAKTPEQETEWVENWLEATEKVITTPSAILPDLPTPIFASPKIATLLKMNASSPAGLSTSVPHPMSTPGTMVKGSCLFETPLAQRAGSPGALAADDNSDAASNLSFAGLQIAKPSDTHSNSPEPTDECSNVEFQSVHLPAGVACDELSSVDQTQATAVTASLLNDSTRIETRDQEGDRFGDHTSEDYSSYYSEDDGSSQSSDDYLDVAYLRSLSSPIKEVVDKMLSPMRRLNLAPPTAPGGTQATSYLKS